MTILNGFLGVDRDWDFLAGLETTDRVLMGYSMGGRMALQRLVEEPARYDRAVIISAGLNLEEGSERPARRERDEIWARRFESDSWAKVMRDWNAQPVFGGHLVERFETDYDRRELARQLRENSPGTLPPLAPALPGISIPVLWIAGELDRAYVAVARQAVALLPRGEIWICPDAGHRVPWEQRERFVARVTRFLRE